MVHWEKQVILGLLYCSLILGNCAPSQESASDSDINNEVDVNEDVATTPAEETPKLLFVQILSRHGERSPMFFYPNDPNPKSFWEGNGKLTKLGKKQHYALGKYLRSRYENFSTFTPIEIDAITNDYDRTILSASSNLASFFAPSKDWELEENLKWQPIVVRYTPLHQDKVFNIYYKCPTADAELQGVYDSSEYQSYMANQAEMVNEMSYRSGLNLSHQEAVLLGDLLISQKKYNLTIPDWAEPLYENFTEMGHEYGLWRFKTRLLRRMRAGPLLKVIIEKMKQKLRGDIPEKKFQLYCASNANIMGPLISMNLFNTRQPPFGATLLFELHELPGGTPALRMLFLNSTHPEVEIEPPHLLVLEGCTEFCPLEYFVNYTRDVVPEDWDRECQLG